jgi:hypothetical protein
VRQGAIRVHVVSPGVVEVVYAGYVSATLLEEKAHEFYATLRRSPATHWIADATGLQGFDPKVNLLGAPWVDAFKSQGGRLLILVSTSPSVRMAGSTLSFAAGVPIKSAANSAEAMALLPPR